MKKKKNRTIWQIVLIIIIVGSLLSLYITTRRMQQNVRNNYKVILVIKTVDKNNGFWTSLCAGFTLGADEYGVNVEIMGPLSENDIEGQNACIERAIEEHPDAIVVAPGSYTETSEVLQTAHKQGIQIILVDSIIDESLASSVVATDNVIAGKELGEYAKQYLGEHDKIGIVAHVKGSSTAMEREKGLREGLGDYEKNVEEVVFCGSSYDKAYELTEKMLKEHPDIKMIMGTNEYSAVGAARAIKALGLKDTVKVVGFDNSIEEIQLLEEGIFQGIIIQQPFKMGYLGLEQAVKSVENKKVSQMVDSGCKLITRENMYEDENQRLLYPFNGEQ